MRKLVVLGWLFCVGCGAPELKLEDFLGKYEGSTTMTGPAPVPRDGAQTMSVFRALDAAERVRFAEFTTVQLGKAVASCPFNGKLADGLMEPVPVAKCGWLQPTTEEPCGMELDLLSGTVSLLGGDALTVSLSGTAKRSNLAGTACAQDTLGRWTLVFSGRRVPE